MLIGDGLAWKNEYVDISALFDKEKAKEVEVIWWRLANQSPELAFWERERLITHVEKVWHHLSESLFAD